MVGVNLNEIELHTGTVEGKPEVEAHFAFPLFWATGNASTPHNHFEWHPNVIPSNWPVSPYGYSVLG